MSNTGEPYHQGHDEVYVLKHGNEQDTNRPKRQNDDGCSNDDNDACASGESISIGTNGNCGNRSGNILNDSIPNEFDSWDDDHLELSDKLLRGVYGYGFEKPSPIQKRSIIPFLKGNDIIAQAQSGTGKTGAFTIGMLQLVDPEIKETQGVIMAPTRELARQIYDVISNIGTYLTDITIQLLVGGITTESDMNTLSSGVPPTIVVGCPGRIHDMMRRNCLKTDNIRALILDEADEMLSFGFKEQVHSIFQFLNSNVQIALFSATMPKELFSLTEKFMRNPIEILVKQEQLTLQGISQFFINVDNDQQKYLTLKDIFSRITVTQCIIYCNSVKRVKDLYEAMVIDQFPVSRLHSDMTEEERKNTYNQFRSGTSRVLISSNVTARGIDVQQVSTVINFDVPKDPHTYLHRIGRSGRWGRKGIAINFVTRRDSHKLKEIEKYYSTTISELPDNFEQFIVG